jgi:hypothetical protein
MTTLCLYFTGSTHCPLCSSPIHHYLLCNAMQMSILPRSNKSQPQCKVDALMLNNTLMAIGECNDLLRAASALHQQGLLTSRWVTVTVIRQLIAVGYVMAEELSIAITDQVYILLVCDMDSVRTGKAQCTACSFDPGSPMLILPSLLFSKKRSLNTLHSSPGHPCTVHISSRFTCFGRLQNMAY